jgi:dihydropyrimidinase
MSSAGKKNFSLVVQGGTLVIPGVGQVDADIGIANGKIAAIGTDLAAQAADVYDATGKKVLPGIFDPHTHIGNERSYDEEAETETRAAVLGGVTTIGIFLRSLEDSYSLHLPGFRRAMDELSYVDSVFHRRFLPSSRSAKFRCAQKNSASAPSSSTCPGCRAS